MEFILTADEIEELKNNLKRAVPYTEEEINALSYDGPLDLERDIATNSKDLLDRYYKKMGWEKDY